MPATAGFGTDGGGGGGGGGWRPSLTLCLFSARCSLACRGGPNRKSVFGPRMMFKLIGAPR